jgi:hypothetical protein
MAENIDGSALGDLDPYNTKIPALADAANIQSALRLYHYGSESAPASAEGIVGGISKYLKDLEIAISNASTPTATILGASDDLNTKTEIGLYHQNSNTDARSGSNYPQYDGLAYKGLLSVSASEGLVYQTYYMYVSQTLVFVFNRIYDSAWSSWVRSAESTHTHDDRYYTKTSIDASLTGKQSTITGAATTVTTLDLTTNRAVISNDNGKIAVSATTATELGFLSGTTSSVQTQISDRWQHAGTQVGRQIWVQATEPASGMAAGDLWFW